MTAERISRFPVPKLEELPEDLVERITTVQEKIGFVPNVFLALAYRPAELRAFLAYHDAIMEREEGLTKAEREMIVVATSGANDCQYCVISHGAILRILSKRPLLADQLAINYRKADLSPRERAMIEFALKVSLRSEEISDADMEAMRAAGFSDDEIWDIGAVASFFAMSNRLANITSMRPNDEFYTLGRSR